MSNPKNEKQEIRITKQQTTKLFNMIYHTPDLSVSALSDCMLGQ